MLLLKKESLPEGEDWLCEIKLDGYRAVAIKSGGNNSAPATTTISLRDIEPFPLPSRCPTKP
jgi:hypothetical protein